MSIPEIGEDVNCDSSSDEATAHVEQSFISGNFQLSSWDDSNSIMFSAPHKRTKGNNGDILTSLSNTDSQVYWNAWAFVKAVFQAKKTYIHNNASYRNQSFHLVLVEHASGQDQKDIFLGSRK